MNALAMCSAWRIRRDNDIGTFGEKHRRSQVVQTGGVSVWIRIFPRILSTRWIPELSDLDIHTLASKYDFSGGQWASGKYYKLCDFLAVFEAGEQELKAHLSIESTNGSATHISIVSNNNVLFVSLSPWECLAVRGWSPHHVVYCLFLT